MPQDNFVAILARLRQITEAKSDAALARILKVTPQALSYFKKQGRFPSELLIGFCFKRQVSIDWLMTGRGPARRGLQVTTPSVCYRPGSDPDVDLIINFITRNPEDKEYILQLLKSRSEMREALKHLTS